MTRLLLRCGCEIPFREDTSPMCPTHGVQPVCRVLEMPKPTFRGTATGPCVKTEDLAPHVGKLTGTD